MTSLPDDAGCTEGFQPLFRTNPLLDATGPYFYKPMEDGFVVGLRVQDKHTNASGTIHGGLVAALADVSIGYVTSMSKTPPLRMMTASLTIDYVGTVKMGDWVEAHVSIVKTERRLAFANAVIKVGATPVASAGAVFLVLDDNG
ncbi:PaaI family thioesterase [Burkholderia stagnalis]|uniref:Esterase n=1 Tax=Burkholderia stagnalis TaxID=1503054 RepID=A0A119VV76_9BURK|nr:PaaI family thioesterase [Burkholderia stagnalis]KVZ02494.1 esterase [Burkholderia stagnalis]KWA53606.1 esterase [Burkholderia stagnalis]KWA58721.1 esterase [Burkholderia stagnalis]KWA60609.1 esterase [Burkholderia stagnalis]KWC97483.1 esterase [Burkholderia stagnalis]